MRSGAACRLKKTASHQVTWIGKSVGIGHFYRLVLTDNPPSKKGETCVQESPDGFQCLYGRNRVTTDDNQTHLALLTAFQTLLLRLIQN